MNARCLRQEVLALVHEGHQGIAEQKIISGQRYGGRKRTAMQKSYADHVIHVRW